jgi:hypothetical protein
LACSTKNNLATLSWRSHSCHNKKGKIYLSKLQSTLGKVYL